MGNLILKAALMYIESHPEIVAELLDQIVKSGINALKAHNAAKA